MWKEDPDLSPVISNASNDDLDTLVQYVLKAMTEKLSGTDSYKANHPNHKAYRKLLENEMRAFGGHTLINMFRSEAGPPWAEIVRDVADRLGAEYDKKASVPEIEEAIYIRLLEKAWASMSDDEKKNLLESLHIGYKAVPGAMPLAVLIALIHASGFAAYSTAVVVANAVANTVLGSGLTIAANAALTRWISVFTGPIGMVLTALWALLDLAGPAYRVTIPCVIHVAMLRRKKLGLASGEALPPGALEEFQEEVESTEAEPVDEKQFFNMAMGIVAPLGTSALRLILCIWHAFQRYPAAAAQVARLITYIMKNPPKTPADIVKLAIYILRFLPELWKIINAPDVQKAAQETLERLLKK